MTLNKINEHSMKLLHAAQNLIEEATHLQEASKDMVQSAAHSAGDPFVMAVTVFVLACFIGYYVVWKVTPALHSPLMAVTNAISSVIIVGAIISFSQNATTPTLVCGFIAIVLASVNIFGGFFVTQRMLSMFAKKNKNK